MFGLSDRGCERARSLPRPPSVDERSTARRATGVTIICAIEDRWKVGYRASYPYWVSISVPLTRIWPMSRTAPLPPVLREAVHQHHRWPIDRSGVGHMDDHIVAQIDEPVLHPVEDRQRAHRGLPWGLQTDVATLVAVARNDTSVAPAPSGTGAHRAIAGPIRRPTTSVAEESTVSPRSNMSMSRSDHRAQAPRAVTPGSLVSKCRWQSTSFGHNASNSVVPVYNPYLGLEPRASSFTAHVSGVHVRGRQCPSAVGPPRERERLSRAATMLRSSTMPPAFTT
jgi:hypothetical protein